MIHSDQNRACGGDASQIAVADGAAHLESAGHRCHQIFVTTPGPGVEREDLIPPADVVQESSRNRRKSLGHTQETSPKARAIFHLRTMIVGGTARRVVSLGLAGSVPVR